MYASFKYLFSNPAKERLMLDCVVHLLPKLQMCDPKRPLIPQNKNKTYLLRKDGFAARSANYQLPGRNSPADEKLQNLLAV
jgi:hypothetical protein